MRETTVATEGGFNIGKRHALATKPPKTVVSSITTGTASVKRGRPPLKLTPAQREERKRQQTLKRVKALRKRQKS